VQPPGLTERQSAILAEAAKGARVGVEDLAVRFAVSPQTVRKDLNFLSARGLIARVHGGATVANSVSNTGYEQRRNEASDAKQVIARIAAELVPENSSLILNIGTTTEHVARALYTRQDLVVVTNNINVVNILSGSPRKEIRLAGGVVRQTDGAIVGEATAAFIDQFKVDTAIIGASALDEDGAVLDFDDREVAVARAIIRNARQTILVAHHEKFERRAPIRICDIGDLDCFVTDAEPPDGFVAACAAAGTRILTPDRWAADQAKGGADQAKGSSG
jgi:DeoR family glycerol-3-phosphate regulon repressor